MRDGDGEVDGDTYGDGFSHIVQVRLKTPIAGAGSRQDSPTTTGAEGESERWSMISRSLQVG